jgi:ADP-ribose pyrophosphatase YjhB (NUDIX family)
VIHDTDGRLLLVMRGNPPGQGLWSIPGGKVESGETDEMAVLREVDEETGLVITIERYCGTVTRPAPDGIFVIFDYLCHDAGTGKMRPGSDAADVKWVDANEFAAMNKAGLLVDLLAETVENWRVGPTQLG